MPNRNEKKNISVFHSIVTQKCALSAGSNRALQKADMMPCLDYHGYFQQVETGKYMGCHEK